MAAVLCEHRVEPMRGIEPPLQPYKGRVLPLNYIGMLVVVAGVEPAHDCVSDSCLTTWRHHTGCCGWIRTSASQGNSPVSYRSTTQQRMRRALARSLISP